MAKGDKEFKPEEGAEGQVDLTGQKVKVNVSWDSDVIHRYKLFGGEGAMTITDIEYARDCKPTTNSKGKEKAAKMTPRIKVARKLRFPKVKQTPSGGEYETHVDAYEKALKEIFEE